MAEEIVTDLKHIGRVDAAFRTAEKDVTGEQSSLLATKDQDGGYSIWARQDSEGMLFGSIRFSSIMRVSGDIFKSVLKGRYNVDLDEIISDPMLYAEIPSYHLTLECHCRFAPTQAWTLRRQNG